MTATLSGLLVAHPALVMANDCIGPSLPWTTVPKSCVGGLPRSIAGGMPTPFRATLAGDVNVALTPSVAASAPRIEGVKLTSNEQVPLGGSCALQVLLVILKSPSWAPAGASCTLGLPET